MSEMRKQAIEGIRVGDSFTVSRTFTENDVQCFGDMTKDYNPVHYDQRFSSVKAFEGRICHGLLVASLITEIGGQLGWLASRMDFHFKKPVYFGDSVQCRLTITHVDPSGRGKGEAVYTNQHGAVVLEAFLAGIAPGDVERDVLNAMVDEGDPTNKLHRSSGTL